MHILELESFYKTLCRAQHSFSEKLHQDADYLELKDLPSREDATTPHQILRGANLRAKLEAKYSAPAILAAKDHLKDALGELEYELDLLADSNTHAEPVSVKSIESPSSDISICQIAAENAVALASAPLSIDNVQILQSEKGPLATDAPSVEDIIRVRNDDEADLKKEHIYAPFPELTVKRTDANSSELDNDIQMEFLPLPTPASRMGRAMFAGAFGLVLIMGIGAIFPGTAGAIETIVSLNSVQ